MIQELKNITEKGILGPLVASLLATRILHEKMAAEMEGLDRELLKRHTLIHTDSGERITEPCDSWLCDDDDLTGKFYADRDDTIGERYPALPRGHCPALVAESEVLDAERKLLSAGEELLPGCGEVFNPNLRDRILETLCGIGAAQAQRVVANLSCPKGKTK